jgi:hypothetical protein
MKRLRFRSRSGWTGFGGGRRETSSEAGLVGRRRGKDEEIGTREEWGLGVG